MRVGLDHDFATGISDAFEFGSEVDGLFPGGDGLRRFLANAPNVQKLVLGSTENFRSFTEMLEQLPDPHGADVLDHVQSNQRFPGIHAA